MNVLKSPFSFIFSSLFFTFIVMVSVNKSFPSDKDQLSNNLTLLENYIGELTKRLIENDKKFLYEKNRYSIVTRKWYLKNLNIEVQRLKKFEEDVIRNLKGGNTKEVILTALRNPYVVKSYYNALKEILKIENKHESDVLNLNYDQIKIHLIKVNHLWRSEVILKTLERFLSLPDNLDFPSNKKNYLTKIRSALQFIKKHKKIVDNTVVAINIVRKLLNNKKDDLESGLKRVRQSIKLYELIVHYHPQFLSELKIIRDKNFWNRKLNEVEKDLKRIFKSIVLNVPEGENKKKFLIKAIAMVDLLELYSKFKASLFDDKENYLDPAKMSIEQKMKFINRKKDKIKETQLLFVTLNKIVQEYKDRSYVGENSYDVILFSSNKTANFMRKVNNELTSFYSNDFLKLAEEVLDYKLEKMSTRNKILKSVLRIKKVRKNIQFKENTYNKIMIKLDYPARFFFSYGTKPFWQVKKKGNLDYTARTIIANELVTKIFNPQNIMSDKRLKRFLALRNSYDFPIEELVSGYMDILKETTLDEIELIIYGLLKNKNRIYLLVKKKFQLEDDFFSSKEFADFYIWYQEFKKTYIRILFQKIGELYKDGASQTTLSNYLVKLQNDFLIYRDIEIRMKMGNAFNKMIRGNGELKDYLIQKTWDEYHPVVYRHIWQKGPYVLIGANNLHYLIKSQLKYHLVKKPGHKLFLKKQNVTQVRSLKKSWNKNSPPTKVCPNKPTSKKFHNILKQRPSSSYPQAPPHRIKKPLAISQSPKVSPTIQHVAIGKSKNIQVPPSTARTLWSKTNTAINVIYVVVDVGRIAFDTDDYMATMTFLSEPPESITDYCMKSVYLMEYPVGATIMTIYYLPSGIHALYILTEDAVKNPKPKSSMANTGANLVLNTKKLMEKSVPRSIKKKIGNVEKKALSSSNVIVDKSYDAIQAVKSYTPQIVKDVGNKSLEVTAGGVSYVGNAITSSLNKVSGAVESFMKIFE